MRRLVVFVLAVVSWMSLSGRATACYPCVCPPLPVCCWAYEARPVVYVPIAMAIVPTPMPTPSISAPVVSTPNVQISQPRPLTTETIPAAKAAAAVKEPLRPAAFDDMPPLPQAKVPPKPKPVDVPPPMSTLETIPPVPVVPKPDVPKPAPRQDVPTLDLPQLTPPKLESPQPASPTLDVPKLELPPARVAPPSKPFEDIPPLAPPSAAPSPMDTVPAPLTLPVVPKSREKVEPPLPNLVVPPPAAIPSPAPAPVEPAQFLPTDAPRLPLPAPDVKSSETGLPPLALPPVGEPKVTVQASPLAGVRAALPRVRMIPVAATTQAAPSGKRKVGIFNYTQNPLELVIEGEKIVLPRRHYLQAEVPASFAWRIASGEMRAVTVPHDQAGVEMVIE